MIRILIIHSILLMHQGVSNLDIAIDNFSEYQLLNLLERLNLNFTTGPDGIPSFFIKNCAAIFAYSLYILFNLFIKNCCLPEIWSIQRYVHFIRKVIRMMLQISGLLLFYVTFFKYLKYYLMIVSTLRSVFKYRGINMVL